ncbi:integrase core domain-containing protein, partial [Psychroflexus sediminis]
IKNEYLNLWHIDNLRVLRAKAKKAVEHYNTKRQHDSLSGKTPKEFKNYVLNLDSQERPMTIIYADGNYKIKEALKHHSLNPNEEPQAHNCPIGL